MKKEQKKNKCHWQIFTENPGERIDSEYWVCFPVFSLAVFGVRKWAHISRMDGAHRATQVRSQRVAIIFNWIVINCSHRCRFHKMSNVSIIANAANNCDDIQTATTNELENTYVSNATLLRMRLTPISLLLVFCREPIRCVYIDARLRAKEMAIKTVNKVENATHAHFDRQ